VTAGLRLAPADDAAEWADIGYTRISDDRTGVAASPARQRKAITELAASEGRTIHHWYEDLSKSAYRPGVVRPAFDAALEACAERPVRRLWVMHDDRLMRQGDEDDLPRLIRAVAPAKITIRCVEASDLKLWQAEGKMSALVRNAVNSYETVRKHERVMNATEDRARKGRFPGGQRRFGYKQRDTRVVRHQDDAGVITERERPSGPLVLVKAEAEAIADGYRMIATGSTLYAVTKDWQDRGLTGPTGAEFTPVAVRDVLLRAANAGISTYKGEPRGPGDWPRIVDPDTYAAVKAILTDPSRRRGRGKPVTTLLAGVLRCGKCGGPVNGGYRGAREDGTPRLNYRCRSGHVSRARDPLDAAITEALIGHLREQAASLHRPRKAQAPAVARAVEQVAELRGKIEGFQAAASDADDPADLLAILRGLRAKLAAAEARIVKAAGTPASHKMVSSGDVQAAWFAAGTDERRTVISEQVERIVLGAPGRPYVEVFWRGED